CVTTISSSTATIAAPVSRALTTQRVSSCAGKDPRIHRFFRGMDASPSAAVRPCCHGWMTNSGLCLLLQIHSFEWLTAQRVEAEAFDIRARCHEHDRMGKRHPGSFLFEDRLRFSIEALSLRLVREAL